MLESDPSRQGIFVTMDTVIRMSVGIAVSHYLVLQLATALVHRYFLHYFPFHFLSLSHLLFPEPFGNFGTTYQQGSQMHDFLNTPIKNVFHMSLSEYI